MELDPVQAVLASNADRKAIHKGEKVPGSQIQSCFKDAVFFITGGSGFIGKQLVEKLLRSCPDIKKIYLLLRPKKGIPIQERLDKILDDPVYDALRKIRSEFRSQVAGIEGDVSELSLGISDSQRKMITEDTTCIIHAAATIRFDEPLKHAVLLNVRGTREIVKLGHECKKLRSFVHISTAFVHIYKPEVSEKFYDPPINPDTIIDLVENMDEPRLESLTERMIEDWPNTYTYTKSIAEAVVKQYGKGLPICVVRPAIVSSSYREPEMGWIDKSNVFGPSGILLGLGLGMIHIIYADRDVRVDLVPVDFVNNLIVGAAWSTCENVNDDDIKIYTLSGRRQFITWREASECLKRNVVQYVTPKALWYCWGDVTKNRYLFAASWLFLHFIPSFFIDIILKLVGSRIRLVNIYKKAYKLSHLLSYFTTKQWEFYDDNTMQLYNKMSEDDKEIFCFDITATDTQQQLLFWNLGIRKYIVKDNLEGTLYGRKKQCILGVVHYITSILYAYLIFKVLKYMFFAITFIFGW